MRHPILALLLLLAAPAVSAQEACAQMDFGSAPVAVGLDDRLVLTADEAELTQDGLSTLAGTVRLMQGGNRFETQALSFDEKTRIARVQSESLFRNRNLVIHSESAEFDLGQETGTFHETEFTLVNRAARGGADSVRLNKSGTVDVEDVYYTTCAPGSNAWILQASSIKLDRDRGLGTARNALLRFGYVPILYAPWFQFPIDNRRRSGFLFPTFGNTTTTGFDLRIPYYVNLAPNYDAQVTPRYMSDRGNQLAVESRYLFSRSQGQVAYEYLNHDAELERQGFSNSTRSYFRFDHAGLLNDRLGLDAKYGKVSDPGYFEDLSGQFEAAATTHLERSASLTYAAPAAYTVTAGVTEYQSITRDLLGFSEPYRRLPQVRVEAMTRKALFATRLGFSGEYVNFSRNFDVPGEPRQGQRLDLDPHLLFQLDRSAWYLGSRADWRYTQYQVDGTTGLSNGTPNRSLPVTSVEGGLRFERTTAAGELQTLEPGLFYLYAPYVAQSGLPRFDVGEPDFDFVQLFARNRFSGVDRISDANHLATAFTSRLIDPNDGVQRYSVSFGQIYRFTAPQVGADETGLAATPDRAGTDYIGELDYRPSATLRFGATGQWSPERDEFVRAGIGARYLRNRFLADLRYRFRTDLPSGDLEQADFSIATPITGGWTALGRWRNSLAEHRTLEALGGLEYSTCCWAVRTAFRRYQYSFDTAAFEPAYTNGIYLQLELKGLSRIGAGFQTLVPALQ